MTGPIATVKIMALLATTISLSANSWGARAFVPVPASKSAFSLGRCTRVNKLNVPLPEQYYWCHGHHRHHRKPYSTTIHKSLKTSANDNSHSHEPLKIPQEKATTTATAAAAAAAAVPLYRSEGLFAVNKPLDWTSSDVVSFIRKMLERDARERGAKPVKVGSRRNKSRIIKVGHGGTLDPLATGVLVIGVGKGTKELQSYLSGSKKYIAGAQFGFETTTLDMDKTANITKTAAYEHITMEDIERVLPSFTGTIQQIPPMFSAIKKGGKKLYEKAREGTTAEDMKLEPREVHVYEIQLVNQEETQLPSFDLGIDCGGGTYVRSLIRDIAYKLDSVATMTSLERTKQAQFTLENALPKTDWSPDAIYDAIDKFNAERSMRVNH